MNRQVAVDLAKICAAELLPRVHLVNRTKQMPNMRREYLVQIRDRLHAACTSFEADDSAEEHEDVYLPLFDALAIVSDELLSNTADPARMPVVLMLLDSLRFQRQPV